MVPQCGPMWRPPDLFLPLIYCISLGVLANQVRLRPRARPERKVPEEVTTALGHNSVHDPMFQDFIYTSAKVHMLVIDDNIGTLEAQWDHYVQY
jgi:hypothetical protein